MSVNEFMNINDMDNDYAADNIDNDTESFYDEWMSNEARRTLSTSLFFVILFVVVIGIISNIILVYAIVAYRHIRHRIHYVFVTNLAVADILFLLSWGIQTLVWDGWIAFGEIGVFAPWDPVADTIGIIAQMTVMIAQSSTVAALAVDQYIVIVHPITAQRWRSMKSAIIASIIIWTVGFAVGMPIGVVYAHAWHLKASWLVCSILEVLFNYLTPLTVITTCYVSIYKTTRSMRRQNSDSQGSQTTTSPYVNFSRQMRLLSLNGSITIAFIVSWGLYHAVHIIVEVVWVTHGFNHPFFTDGHFAALDGVIWIILTVYAALNPFLYVVTNRRLGKHVWRVVKCIPVADSSQAERPDDSVSTKTSMSPQPCNLAPIAETGGSKE